RRGTGFFRASRRWHLTHNNRQSLASAADFGEPAFGPAPPAFSWTGCYIGGAVGGAWSSQDVSNTALASLDQAGVTATINATGVIGGIYGGCNFQWASTWVVGIEGDWSGTNLSGTARAPTLIKDSLVRFPAGQIQTAPNTQNKSSRPARAAA